jgi:outer membrane protein
MEKASRLVAAWAMGGVAALILGVARGENLAQAWDIALGINPQLRARQAQSVAQGWNLAAARSARLPTVRSFAFNAFLATTPVIQSTFTGVSTAGAASGMTGSVPATGRGAASGLPASFPFLGAGQRDLPASITYASVPLYTGGRILRTIDSAAAQVGAQRNEEFRTALDLKLMVAEAYIGVLRAQKNLQVARSNVEQLASFARDVRNRRAEGLAIRSDELAAEVSLANAQVSAIQAQTTLASAWATYNRYLGRPLTTVVPLVELTNFPTTTDIRELATQATRAAANVVALDEGEVNDLIATALRARPELASLTEQARSYRAQADASRAGVRPQAGFSMAFVYLGNNNQIPQGLGAATFYVDWTITDGGASRRRAQSLRQQELATLMQRADTAADVALQVRTRWLDLHQARLRVPVARLAIAQAEENVHVVGDRYRQQLSTYTEVLDAENRRVQALTNYYNAIYDESLARFRLRRAVGDL